MTQYHFKVELGSQEQRLDIFLAQQMPGGHSRSFVKKLIEFGHVRVNESLGKAGHKVIEGEEIQVDVPEDFLTPQYVEPQDIPLDIFYEDENLFVINKPCGMLVHPASGCYKGTLVNALLHHSVQLSDFNTDIRPGIVHRLDQETSGLMLVAKDNITHARLAKQFQRHLIKKQYVALVEGDVEFDEGRVDASIGRDPFRFDKKTVREDDSAKEAVTFYRVVKRARGVSLVHLYPRTGRTHQLRVHMRYLGHPILGDGKYGKASTFFRLALHAQSIGFLHPRTKCYVEFSTKTPEEFLSRVAEGPLAVTDVSSDKKLFHK